MKNLKIEGLHIHLYQIYLKMLYSSFDYRNFRYYSFFYNLLMNFLEYFHQIFMHINIPEFNNSIKYFD